jgi:hypothetical protein
MRRGRRNTTSGGHSGTLAQPRVLPWVGVSDGAEDEPAAHGQRIVAGSHWGHDGLAVHGINPDRRPPNDAERPTHRLDARHGRNPGDLPHTPIKAHSVTDLDLVLARRPSPTRSPAPRRRGVGRVGRHCIGVVAPVNVAVILPSVSQDRAKKWLVLVFAAAVAAGCVAVGSASGKAASGKLRAFQRPARATDAVPRAFLPIFGGRYGTVVASRRIATGTGFRGHASVYLIRLKQHYTCLLRTIPRGGAGAGCSPSGEFLSATLPIQASTGARFLSGVVANEIARVAFVDPRGRVHPMRLTRDGGFLYSCRHRNGCVGLVSAINGYNRHGSLVFHDLL